MKLYSSFGFKSAILRSMLFIGIGAALIVWSSVALHYMIMLVGALFLLTGIISSIGAYRNRTARMGNWVSLSAFGSVVFGSLLLFLPVQFAAFFMFLLGVVLLIAAIGQFATLMMAKKLGGHVSPVNYFFPALIFMAGVVVLFNPFDSAESVFIVFGLTAMFYGITDIINQITLYRLRKKGGVPENRPDIPETEDVEYEEVE